MGLFVCLDRSLSGAADKDTILRAEGLVFQRRCKAAAAAATTTTTAAVVEGTTAATGLVAGAVTGVDTARAPATRTVDSDSSGEGEHYPAMPPLPAPPPLLPLLTAGDNGTSVSTEGQRRRQAWSPVR